MHTLPSVDILLQKNLDFLITEGGTKVPGL